ncbi:MAG: class IV adenylate cyclase [Planctomycetes bacterium]|nr:class IV adenylate cyclase [Planctomycetota bacterium]
MLEIEMKFPVADFAPIVQRLTEWRAIAEPTIEEVDRYFNAPDRDFAQTDEAFRLRSIGAENRVTYKGPKQGGPTKTRTEIEIAVASGSQSADDFCRLVQHLGYRPTAIVKKRRTSYGIQRGVFALHVCCDDVEYLARFVEVEIVAAPADRDRAQQVLLDVVRELGLSKSEPRSYLEMVLHRFAST